MSDKMKKTRVVEVARLKKNKRYFKYFRTTKRFKAHDDKEEYKVGDEVIMEETRPMSKDKRWVIKGLVQEAESAKADESNLA